MSNLSDVTLETVVENLVSLPNNAGGCENNFYFLDKNGIHQPFFRQTCQVKVFNSLYTFIKVFGENMLRLGASCYLDVLPKQKDGHLMLFLMNGESIYRSFYIAHLADNLWLLGLPIEQEDGSLLIMAFHDEHFQERTEKGLLLLE